MWSLPCVVSHVCLSCVVSQVVSHEVSHVKSPMWSLPCEVSHVKSFMWSLSSVSLMWKIDTQKGTHTKKERCSLPKTLLTWDCITTLNLYKKSLDLRLWYDRHINDWFKCMHVFSMRYMIHVCTFSWLIHITYAPFHIYVDSYNIWIHIVYVCTSL